LRVTTIDLPEALQRELCKFADKYERATWSGAREPTLKSPSPTLIGQERERTDAALEHLCQTRALKPVFGRRRDQAHVIERYKVADLESLNEQLSRSLLGDRIERGLASISHIYADRAEARNFQDWVIRAAAEKWRTGQSFYGYRIDNALALSKVVTVATSLIAGKGGGKTIRKFSTESVRDSKFVGDHQSKIQRLLVAYYGFEPETAPDFLSKFGLGTPAAPVFVSGQLKAVYDGHAGIDVGEVPFVGLPPNGAFSPALAVKAVLTIENWESFYRHIVEVPEREVIVLYTGGFASVETASILEKLISAGLDWFHWGDIDPYGLAIIQALEGAVGQPSKPHLMSLERLHEIGAWADRPANAKVLQDLADRDGWMQDLAQYFLSEDRTRWLEQEMQDPEPIFRPSNVKPVENPPSEKPLY
jgi:hypothetical protein